MFIESWLIDFGFWIDFAFQGVTQWGLYKLCHKWQKKKVQVFMLLNLELYYIGRFPFNKNPSFKFWNLYRPSGINYIPVHRPDPSHRLFGYCSCKQDTKEQYWEQQFCQIERVISVQLTEMTRPAKVDHLQSWSQIFWSDQTEMVHQGRTVLKSPWILGEVLEKSLNSIFPGKVLEFSSTLNVSKKKKVWING